MGSTEGLEELYETANRTERSGDFLEAAKMYAQLTSILGQMDPREVADLYGRSATGIARCANKDNQYDKAIEILRQQLDTDAGSPVYMRNTLAYSYLSKAALCCSKRYDNGVGLPIGKGETECMDSWVQGAEALAPESDEVVGLLNDSRSAVYDARRRRVYLKHRGAWGLSALFALIALLFVLMGSRPAVLETVVGVLGPLGEGVTAFVRDMVDLVTTTAVPVVGSPAIGALLWWGGGALLYLLVSFPQTYVKREERARRRSPAAGILAIVLLPIAAVLRIPRLFA